MSIKIKKQNKGKFTDYCNGKVTSECIAKGKNSSDPKVRKRAVFAENARKWTPKGLEGLDFELIANNEPLKGFRHEINLSDLDGYSPRLKGPGTVTLYNPLQEVEVIGKKKPSYIGGTNQESRQLYFDTDTELADTIKSVSNRYNLNPNLLASRLAHENILNTWIQAYNKTKGPIDKNYAHSVLGIPYEISGISFGLDDAGTNLMQDKYNMRPMVSSWSDIDAENNNGRPINSVILPEWSDYINLMGADLDYRRNELLKRNPLLKGELLERAIGAAYNMGISKANDYVNKGRIKNTYDPNYIKLK